MTLDPGDETVPFAVVVNHEEQYPSWPDDATDGWCRAAGGRPAFAAPGGPAWITSSRYGRTCGR